MCPSLPAPEVATLVLPPSENPPAAGVDNPWVDAAVLPPKLNPAVGAEVATGVENEKPTNNNHFKRFTFEIRPEQICNVLCFSNKQKAYVWVQHFIYYINLLFTGRRMFIYITSSCCGLLGTKPTKAKTSTSRHLGT